MEPAGRGTDLSPRGAGPRPQSLESRGVRQEVDLSEAGACKMTLGPERKTSGCGGECGELNGGQGHGYPHTAPLCKLDRAHLLVDVVLPLCPWLVGRERAWTELSPPAPPATKVARNIQKLRMQEPPPYPTSNIQIMASLYV